tara:strand:- start:4116 stop:4574 length:459 start_codon:yes stop_codon:yes gene_type:complete
MLAKILAKILAILTILSTIYILMKQTKKRTKQKGRLSFRKNIKNRKIKVCSKKPMTGYYRDGYCMTGPDDSGTHTVCAKLDKEFMDYSKSMGNDLYGVAQPGDNWCLCEYRWNEAYKKNKAPYVYAEATNKRTKRHIIKNIFKSNKRKKYKA